MTQIGRRLLGRNQLSVTELSFGSAAIGNLYKTVSAIDSAQCIENSLQLGINYFDVAPFYGFGLAERRLGDGLRQQPAGSIVVSTKVGRLLAPIESTTNLAEIRQGYASSMPFEPHYDYTYDGIMRSFEDSIQRLGLGKIDLLYVHDIGELTHGVEKNKEYFKQLKTSGYKALESLRNQKVISSIGLGVNEWEVAELALQHGDYDCFLLAGRYTLLEQDALNSFLPLCEQRKVSIVIGGAYNSGILAADSNQLHKTHYDYQAPPQHIIDRVQQLHQVCREYQVNLQAAAIQFPLAHPSVASVCLGTSVPSRIQQTVAYYSEIIPQEFWHCLRARQLIHPEAPIPEAPTRGITEL